MIEFIVGGIIALTGVLFGAGLAKDKRPNEKEMNTNDFVFRGEGRP